MAFELAADVRAELERLARITKRDPNDILRELLEMPRKGKDAQDSEGPDGVVVFPQKFYTTPRGDRLPHGKIVMRLHGKEYHGEVNERGISIKGKEFDMPSPAAKSITGYDVNGWRAFRYEGSNGIRQPLENFRSAGFGR